MYKNILKLILFFLLLLTTFSTTIQAYTYTQMRQIDRKIYVAVTQQGMLEKRLRVERKKVFNRSRVRAYEKTIRKIHREELQYRAQKRKIQKKIRVIEAREDAKIANLASIPGDIHIRVSRYNQTMKVYKGKKLIYTWLVSTGKKGYTTPMGNYKPYYTVRMHYSRKWNMSPMPYSVFYYKGYAIHGTNYASRLGSRASHGCIRLSTRNARKVYNLAKRFGYRRMHIQVT